MPPIGPERDALVAKIVKMHDVEELTYHAIAELLEVPYGSISRLVRRYRKQLNGES